MEKNFDKEFTNFINHLDDIVQTFGKKLNSLGFPIDYSQQSIPILENYLLDKSIRFEDDDFYDASCFLGELFKTNYGGKWQIDTNTNSPYYRKPVIGNFTLGDKLFSPFTILKETLAIRKKGALMQILKSSLNDDNSEETETKKVESPNYRNKSFLEENNIESYSPEKTTPTEIKVEKPIKQEEENQPYKIYKGKAFTREEWLRFEEEEYNRFSSNNKNNLNTRKETPPQAGNGFFLDEKESDW